MSYAVDADELTLGCGSPTATSGGSTVFPTNNQGNLISLRHGTAHAAEVSRRRHGFCFGWRATRATRLSGAYPPRRQSACLTAQLAGCLQTRSSDGPQHPLSNPTAQTEPAIQQAKIVPRRQR